MGPRERDVAHFAVRALPYLIAFRPDIVVPANNFWTVIAAKLAGWCTGGRARIVVTSQAGWSHFERDDLRLGIDGFVAIQPCVYDCAVQFERGRTPVRLIPNGVDIEQFAQGPTARVNLKPPIVIVVSALDDYKQVDLAVQAVARAGMSLLVLGDGPNADRVDQLAHALLGPQRYLHLPKVPHAEVAAYYRAADVFTLPSTVGEAFGIVILEAMAAGLPVVVSDDPVRQWIAGEDGWFVDARDTDAYAKALISAAAARLGPATARHLAQFSWLVVAATYADFFAQVHARPRQASPSLLSLPRLGAAVTLRAWDHALSRLRQQGR
jgi:glycosyltransferase involved in cell wall biosynthesis